MYNIFYKKIKDKFITAVENPFKTEEEFEKYVMNTKEIFSDVFVIKRQVSAGKDILDMIGVDRDKNIVIIENKNIPVTENILSQISRYVLWAKTNPDSIKAMWLETENVPEGIDIEWDNIGIKVIVLAPVIKLSVLRLLKMINCDYSVDLIEVKRFLIGGKELILLNKLEEETEAKIKTVRGAEIYDKKFYKKHHDTKSVNTFFKIVDEIEKINKRKGWNLEKKFNKGYMGFKMGFPNVFGVHWLGKKSFGFFFKVPFSQFSKIKKLSSYEIEYDERWKQVTLKHEEGIKIKKLIPIFEKIYELFMEK